MSWWPSQHKYFGLTRVGTPIKKVIRSHDRLIIIMEISIPGEPYWYWDRALGFTLFSCTRCASVGCLYKVRQLLLSNRLYSDMTWFVSRTAHIIAQKSQYQMRCELWVLVEKHHAHDSLTGAVVWLTYNYLGESVLWLKHNETSKSAKRVLNYGTIIQSKSINIYFDAFEYQNVLSWLSFDQSVLYTLHFVSSILYCILGPTLSLYLVDKEMIICSLVPMMTSWHVRYSYFWPFVSESNGLE